MARVARGARVAERGTERRGVGRRRRSLLVPAVVLAIWRLRQTWRLWLAAELGVLVAVVLVCLVPLFSQVAVSAGVRDALRTPPAQAPGLASVSVGPFPGVAADDPTALAFPLLADPLTIGNAHAIQPQLDAYVRKTLGTYLGQGSALAVSSLPSVFQYATPRTGSSAPGSTLLSLVGDDLSAVPDQFVVTSGRLPAENAPATADTSGDTSGTSGAEIALTPEGASALNVRVGDTLRMAPFAPGMQPLQLHIVGIFTLGQHTDASMRGRSFVGRLGPGGPKFVGALASNAGLLQALVALAGKTTAVNGSQPVLSTSLLTSLFPLVYYYRLNLTHLGANDVSDLTTRLNVLNNGLPQSILSIKAFRGEEGMEIPALLVLGGFQAQVALLQIPVALLLCQVFGLVLLFIQLMADVLVARQADAIAIMRSRGATRGQIFGALTAQGTGLALIALVLGPLVAIPLVSLISQHVLSASDASAIDVVTSDPVAVVLGIKEFAIVAAVVAGGALLFSVRRAANVNIVELRRESARASSRPFWQRLNLDLILGVLGLALYGAYLLLLANVPISTQLQLTPLALVFPVALLVAAALVFLRVFPLVLRGMARASARLRGATMMVAMAQIARAPRQAMRMTLLFALATGFALFALTFIGTEAQRTLDVATFQVGADFSGTLPATSDPTPTLESLTTLYESIPGVRSATAGYSGSARDLAYSDNFSVLAVDTKTYANTSLWTPDLTSQPVSSLTTALAAHASLASTQDTVPAIVDTATAHLLGVGMGDTFTLKPGGYSADTTMRLRVVGVVHAIPTVFDGPGAAADGGFAGGLLVDYTTYIAVYKHDTGSAFIEPNMIWLRTQQTPKALTAVRHALANGPTVVGGLLDREAIVSATRANALHIDLLSTLGIGAAAALLLALVGTWIASWLNARTRLTSFAVLRALGSTPGQTIRVLLWEQGIVYLSSLLLGCGIGWLLSQAILPVILFTDLVTGTATNASVFMASQLPPARLILQPCWLTLLLGGLILACLVALVVMSRTIGRAALGQALRLNED